MEGKPAPQAGTGEPQDKPALRKRRFGCLHFLGGALVVLLLVVGYWYYGLSKARREFAARAEALVRELEAARPCGPESENALPLYEEAFKLRVHPMSCGISEDDAGKLLGPGRRVSEADPAAAAKFLEANGPFLAAIRQAQALPSCFGQFDVRDVKYLAPEPLFEFRRAARILGVAASIEARDGESAESAALLVAGFRLSRDANCFQTLFAYLQQASCERCALTATEAVLGETDFDEDSVERLVSEFKRHRASRGSLAAGCRAERAVSLYHGYGRLVDGTEPAQRVVEQTAGLIADGPPERFAALSRVKCQVWQRSGHVLRDAAAFEQAMDAFARAAELPWPKAMDEADRIAAEAQRKAGWWALVSPALAEAARSVFAREAANEASFRQAELALGCRLFKLKTGAYPESLKDLCAKFPDQFKELPVDPYTGRPMSYRRTEKGCLLWSTYDDRKDDGGSPKTDLVFELTR